MKPAPPSARTRFMNCASRREPADRAPLAWSGQAVSAVASLPRLADARRPGEREVFGLERQIRAVGGVVAQRLAPALDHPPSFRAEAGSLRSGILIGTARFRLVVHQGGKWRP